MHVSFASTVALVLHSIVLCVCGERIVTESVASVYIQIHTNTKIVFFKCPFMVYSVDKMLWSSNRLDTCVLTMRNGSDKKNMEN